MEKKKTIDLSIVILGYKAGDTLYDFVERTQKIFQNENIQNYELVLVGNYILGSNDKTPDVVKKISDLNKNVVYIAEPKLGMMGWDMKSGLALAKGDYLAVIDGDGQMPIEDIARVYKKISQEKLDLVKTYRERRGDGLKRKIFSNVYNFIFLLLFPGLHIKDINSKPKIFSRQAYKKLGLNSDDWFIDAEIMIQARRYNFKIGEIKTQFLGLVGRRSFVRWPTVLEFITNMLLYRIKEFKYKKK